MSLFFDFKAVAKESKDNPFKMVELLREFMYNKLLRSDLRLKFRGSSFLLQPDKILTDKLTDIQYIYQYIFLAAKRDYTLYKLYGITYLPLADFSDINLNSIRTNPLLNITHTEIQFKYED